MDAMAVEREGRRGYRRYSAEFKREQIERILRGEVTAAELSRELGVSRSLIQRWKHLLTKGGETAVGAEEEVVPASALRAAQQRIRELERALGRKTMQVEILEAAQDEVKKSRVGTACPSAAGAPRDDHLRDPQDRPRHGLPGAGASAAALCVPGRSRGRGADQEHRAGARELRLSPHHRDGQPPLRRRSSRAHEGLVQRPRPNERWSSDAIEIACWNGEVVEAAFALDCCDRECLAYVAAARALNGHDIRTLLTTAVTGRFGAPRTPRPIQWLSDNESMYTALETVIVAERAGLVPITTPVRSPESNGLSEAFHGTLRRDYVAGADLSSAAAVLDQLPRWIEDYNTEAPHSSLGMRSPREYRQLLAAAREKRSD